MRRSFLYQFDAPLKGGRNGNFFYDFAFREISQERKDFFRLHGVGAHIPFEVGKNVFV